MIKKLICIECPRGCALSIDIENCKVKGLSGARCPMGKAYAIAEMENPLRIFTATVRTKGLELKLLPVRTNKPIPKKDICKAADAVGKITVDRPVKAGDVIEDNFLMLGVKLIATRAA